MISPLLANIFLHHVFDAWMARLYPAILFERYADDIVIHCRSMEEAERMRCDIEQRFGVCKLMLHPEKTKIVYCRDSNRRETHLHESFDFLGFTFRPRTAITRDGRFFVSFAPAVSLKAQKTISQRIRRWEIHLRTDKSLLDLARMFGREIRGWINYYGRYYKSGLYPILKRLNRRIVRWVQKKYKRYHHQRRATLWLRRVAQKHPKLFAHWELGVLP